MNFAEDFRVLESFRRSAGLQDTGRQRAPDETGHRRAADLSVASPGSDMSRLTQSHESHRAVL